MKIKTRVGELQKLLKKIDDLSGRLMESEWAFQDSIKKATDALDKLLLHGERLAERLKELDIETELIGEDIKEAETQ